MIRVAIPPIGGRQWLGGWNYMLNLVRTMAEYGPADIEIVLFLGTDIQDSAVDELETLSRTTVVRHPAFDASAKSRRLFRALTTGVDKEALAVFRAHRVDVVFEPATFFGWRFPLPTIAWMPDFQHRRLPHLFTRFGRLRREIGFQAQIASGRTIMLSSADAEADCLTFYPNAAGRTRVARFAVPADTKLSIQEARSRVDAMGLPDRYFFLPNQLWLHKNHITAIEAIALLSRRGDGSCIAATSHGFDPRAPDHFAQLKSRVQALGLEGQFKFLGTIDHEDVRALGLCATALINPSTFEGWSTTVEEAKALGTPLILSDLEVHREQAGTEAHYFPQHDASALAELIHTSASRDSAAVTTDRTRAARQTEERLKHFGDAFAATVRETFGAPR